MTDYLAYIYAKHEAQLKFYEDSAKLYEDNNRTEEEGYTKMLRGRAQEERAWISRAAAYTIEEVKREQRREEIELKLHYAAKGRLSESEEQELQDQLFDIRLKAMQRELGLTAIGSQEYAAKEEAIEQALNENKLQKRQRLAQMAAQFEQEYAKKSAEERLRIELKGMEELLKTGTISREQFDSMSSQAKKKYLPGSPKSDRQDPHKDYEKQKQILDSLYEDGFMSEEEYSSRLKAIEADLRHSVMEGLAGCKSEWVSVLTSMYQAWADFADALKDPEGNPFNALAAGISATAAVMSAVMQSVSQMTSAEVEIQTQAIERRYDREAAFAEGNSYLQTKLEKKKEKEIAKMKSDAAKKNFAMQVAMTVATTAANAVEAYGAALKVGGPLGLALAPVAAALALAQGAVQIAALKKQQQVAESSGYAEGGFTRKGRKDEPAGIVHAGEWVASQKLVNNPVSRQVIDVLEYAQRNNTVASLSWDDVSRSVSAPVAMSYASRPEQPAVVQVQQNSPAFDPDPLNQAVSRLVERLEQPIVAHNTVEGPLGYKQAQDEYLRLMSNKSR